MRILLAFDSFKGSLAAAEACAIARATLEEVWPDIAVEDLPLADGGEGTADVLLQAWGGECVSHIVHGPLSTMQIEASYAWFQDRRTALVEVSAASGFSLVPTRHRHPFSTTTLGTGELLVEAAARRPRVLLLGAGGSATVDGGVGAFTALGWSFLDDHGRPIAPGGGDLVRIRTIVPPMDRTFPDLTVLCDVENPLLGPSGAARAFAPQKGASPEDVEVLDRGLAHLADRVREEFGEDVRDVPRGGAAGGIAAFASALLDARLVSGIDYVLDATGFDAAAAAADWVLTGEGCFDEQSLRGKVVSGVIRRARQVSNARIGIIAGRVLLSSEKCKGAGVDAAVELCGGDVTLEKSLREPAATLARRVREFAREHIDHGAGQS
jgi:glycerate 2-kinase